MTTTKTRTSQQILSWETETANFYHGSQEGLLEAKIARPEWFAKLGECERTGRRLVRHWWFEDRKVLLRWTRPNWFELTLHVDDDEQCRRRALGYNDGWRRRVPGFEPMGRFVRIRLKPLRAARADAAFRAFLARAIGGENGPR